jgi:hypothetical protein
MRWRRELYARLALQGKNLLEVEVAMFYHILEAGSQNIPHRHAPLPKVPELKHKFLDLNRDMFEVHAPGTDWIPDYNETEWMAYQESFQNKDSWSVHEEERVAFEIKTTLASAEGAGMAPTLR